MRVRRIWCKTCDRWLWPWQPWGRWYSRTVHLECAYVLGQTERELDTLGRDDG
jgi:hypothetical protein